MGDNPESLCNLCSGQLNSRYYVPLGTLRDAKVYKCGICNLVQTKSKKTSLRRIRSLSSDANWGNIRHAKGLRLDAQKSNLLKVLQKLGAGSTILDVGSSRGQFLGWAQTEFPDLVFMGVEPDGSLVESSLPSSTSRVICCYFEDAKEIENKTFDFIFCNHTLEHVDDALGMLNKMKKHLKPGGRIWIDVPNIYGIADPFLYEEFFIDKHMFHFSPETLVEMLKKCELKVEESFGDMMNIVFLTGSANESNSDFDLKTDSRSMEPEIEAYSLNMLNNRRRIPLLVEKIQKISGLKIYGAGRILDGLIKYGKLEVSGITVADKYLWEKFADLEIRIQNPELVDWTEEGTTLILARSSAEDIRRWLHNKGAKRTLTLEEVWNLI
jgi:SAM-dependent methyltransferase